MIKAKTNTKKNLKPVPKVTNLAKVGKTRYNYKNEFSLTVFHQFIEPIEQIAKEEGRNVHDQCIHMVKEAFSALKLSYTNDEVKKTPQLAFTGRKRGVSIPKSMNGAFNHLMREFGYSNQNDVLQALFIMMLQKRGYDNPLKK